MTSRRLMTVYSLAGGLVVWQLVSSGWVKNPLIMPSPVDTVGALRDLVASGYANVTFVDNVVTSLSVVLAGWLIALLFATPLGMLMGAFRTVDKMVGPIIELLRPIPPIAWIPLAVLWFGVSTGAKIYIVAITASIPALINAYTGVRQVEPVLLQCARTLGVGPIGLLFKVRIPAALPVTMTGLRLSMGNAWTSLVAAELLVSKAGLGQVLELGRRNLDTSTVYAAMVVIGVIGAALSAALSLAERRLTPWRPHHV